MEFVGFRLRARHIRKELSRAYAHKFRARLSALRLGTKLFETLIAHLRELGSKGIMLVVDSYNTNAINFYKKNKFDIIFPLRTCTVMGRRV